MVSHATDANAEGHAPTKSPPVVYTSHSTMKRKDSEADVRKSDLNQQMKEQVEQSSGHHHVQMQMPVQSLLFSHLAPSTLG
jgi:hypothetical protein